MLTCREMNDLITDYLEDRMSFWTRMPFRTHIGMCKDCRLHLKKMRQLIAAAGEIPAEAEVPDEMLETFRNWKKERNA